MARVNDIAEQPDDAASGGKFGIIGRIDNARGVIALAAKAFEDSGELGSHAMCALELGQRGTTEGSRRY